MSSNPAAAPVIGIAVTSRAMWQQQLAAAEATERVNDRQVRLLHAQRDVIDAQLADATRKRDDATRLVLHAQKVIDEMAEARG